MGRALLPPIYTDLEWRRCDGHVNRAACYAQRYAAKEACVKALGTGFREGVVWRDIEVDNLRSGKPVLRLCRRAPPSGWRCLRLPAYRPRSSCR